MPLGSLALAVAIAIGGIVSPAAASAAETGGVTAFSFVVLPFANVSGDQSQDYIAANVTDDLTIALSGIEGSFVIARATAVAVPLHSPDITGIARSLGVGFVVRGSTAKLDNRIRVVVTLYKAGDGARIWHQEFTREYVDLPSMGAEITTHIAAALGATAGNALPRQRSAAPDAGTLDRLLRAKAMLWMAPTLERLAEARVLFEEALHTDPRLVDAMTGLASIHLAVAMAGLTPAPAREVLEGERLLEQALRIAPHNAQALNGLGAINRATGKPREALAAYERALAANPNDAVAYAETARLKIDLGPADEALPLIKRALDLSPLDPQRSLWFTFAGMALLFTDNPPQALTWLKKSVAANPHFVTALVFLAAAEELNGDHAAALRSIADARRITPQLSIKRVDQRLGPEDPRSHVSWKLIVDALRRAGLPE